MPAHTIPAQAWDDIRAEFTLPALDQVRRRLSELMEDPEPIMRQLVRVFIGEGTYCPGFQFLPGGQLQPVVTTLFQRAMELKTPHNYFTLWIGPRPPGLWPGPVPSTSWRRTPLPCSGRWNPTAGTRGRPLTGPAACVALSRGSLLGRHLSCSLVLVTTHLL